MIKPNKTWTLFLDRDGVINYEKHKDYIHHWDEFKFYEDALQALAGLSKMFGRLIVVTNQKGVGKGLTRLEDLTDIHRRMQEAVTQAGGKIDAVLYCIAPDDDDPCRKPNAGMALKARALFPEIDFSRSLMVGNNLSDLQFGRNAGMLTCLLRTTHPHLIVPEGLADYEAVSLNDLSEQLRSQ